MPATACSQCNAWYDSEDKLHDHLRIFHRRFGSEPGGSEAGDAESEVTPPAVIKPGNS
jgi:hypothetical protein